MPYLRFKGFEEGFLRGNVSLLVKTERHGHGST